MFLKAISTSGFRNLKPLKVELSECLTILGGNNAAGKSSLLEAIVFMLAGRSFRTTKPSTLINHQSDSLSVFGQFSNNTRVGVGLERENNKRTVRINNENIHSLSKAASIYPVQILCPESYHLIDSGPSERRKYLDWLLFHVEHSYNETWLSFNKLLKQRNSHLKQQQLKRDDLALNVWDEQFVHIAYVVNEKRTLLLDRLRPLLLEVLGSLNFELVDELSFSYYAGFTGSLIDRLKESRERDIAVGSTQYGPHKGDLKIKVESRLVKDVLSRGQKKVLINGLYLSQTQQLKLDTEKDSLFIIDDFSSELDDSNQANLLSILKSQKGVQIILSCLRPLLLKPLVKGYNNVRMFHVEHGKVISESLTS